MERVFEPSDDSAAKEIIDRLARWLLIEVSPVIAAGANWKVIVYGSASGDVRAVLEKHQRISK